MKVVKYYNRTRGPLSVTLASGASTAVAPKSWIDVPIDEDGSANLGELVLKGLLVRAAVQPEPEPVQPEISVVASAPAPVPEAEKVAAPVEAEAEVAAESSAAKTEQVEVSETTGDATKASSSRNRTKAR